MNNRVQYFKQIVFSEPYVFRNILLALFLLVFLIFSNACESNSGYGHVHQDSFDRDRIKSILLEMKNEDLLNGGIVISDSQLNREHIDEILLDMRSMRPLSGGIVIQHDQNP